MVNLTTDWYVEHDGMGHVAICHPCRWRQTRLERETARRALGEHCSTVEHLKRVGRW